MRSSLEIFTLATGRSRVVWQSDDLYEAPNWSPDGRWLLINGAGRLWRLPVGGGTPEQVGTDFADDCNNDHGISADGRRIVLTHRIDGLSCIYLMPWDGGVPQRVTPNLPSYWHGWSPDGATLAYCARRDGQYDIYTCPVTGGDEVQLTGRDRHEGHNDGPDYSPDGRWIWFNSDRTGQAQIWRMRPDGSDLRQMTDDERVNWFPHPSPDGRYILYLSYPPGTEQHPRDRDVILRLMTPDGADRRDLLAFNGGQGTINVPCWAPDASAFAYMRYERP